MGNAPPANGISTEGFRLGIRGMDDDHFILISLTGELHDAVVGGRGELEVERVLASLVSYATLHFTREERLMRAHRYPGLSEHKAEHDLFARRVFEFQTGFRDGRRDVSEEIARYLKSWIVGHILGHDRQLAPFLLERGVR